MQPRQQPKKPDLAITPVFKFYPVKIEPDASAQQLVSALKRLLTEAKVKAVRAEADGYLAWHVDLRIAVAYGSQRLIDVVDGKINGDEAAQALRSAITALNGALH